MGKLFANLAFVGVVEAVALPLFVLFFNVDLGHALPGILGVTALMLAIVFKSVLVPLKAVVMNSLSVAATFGLITLVFQHGIGGQIFGLDGPTSAIYVLVPVVVGAGSDPDAALYWLARMLEGDYTATEHPHDIAGYATLMEVLLDRFAPKVSDPVLNND